MTVDQYIQANVSLLLDIRNNTRPEGTPALSFVDLFPEGAPPLVNAPPSAVGNGQTTVTPAPARRGRGRPVTGETPPATPPPATVAETPAAVADPFATSPAASPAPTATLEQVREALKALSATTTQDNALAVLKSAGGVDNLTELQKTPEKYGLVVQAVQKAAPGQVVTVATPAADPFETAAPAAPAAAAVATETFDLATVKAELIKAQKRTAVDKVQAVVIKHGGSGPDGKGGVGVSLTALAVSAYATVVNEVRALPTTK